MKVRTWHVGKIVILWAWGAAAIVVGLQVLKDFEKTLTEHVLIGFALLILLLIIPIILSVVTWQWFSGKEPVAKAPTAPPEQNRTVESGRDG